MNRGFTLVEIIVALAIISTLTLVVMQIYLVTTKIEIEAQEEDQARIAIQNIHRAYVSDPVDWQETVYTSYGIPVPGTLEQTFIYDSGWQLLDQGSDGAYVITYTYTSIYDAEAGLDVYDLEIDLVYSDKRTIFTSIDLGRMVRP